MSNNVEYGGIIPNIVQICRILSNNVECCPKMSQSSLGGGPLKASATPRESSLAAKVLLRSRFTFFDCEVRIDD